MGDVDRPAFYALAPGGWRDYWTLLHPPYTLWHLSYVVLGASAARSIDVRWLVESLAAFFLAVGIAAHALDELNGRPLRTRIPDGVLWGMAGVSLAGALAFGIDGALRASPWLIVFMLIGSFIVLAYNLELLGGRFHTDAWFAAAWGAFPALTAAFVQQGRITLEATLIAVACAFLSAAQRVLSTPVRRVRRHATDVAGRIRLDDGGVEPIDSSTLRAAPEGALRWMSFAVPVLAIGVLLTRLR